MDKKAFFSYYIPALETAFSDENLNADDSFGILFPCRFYPENLCEELEEYENSHYESLPIIAEINYLFDALCHRFISVSDKTFEDEKEKILENIEEIKKGLNL